MKTITTRILSTLIVLMLGFSANTQAQSVLSNGDFSAGLTGWTTMNSGTGADMMIVWEVTNPTGTNQVVENGASGGPASRVIYQDFIVPAAGVVGSNFSFDYQAQNTDVLNSDTFTTFDNMAFGGLNGTRIDILDPASDVFTGPVLFNLFAPTDGTPVGTAAALVPMTFADPAALTAFLDANAGSTLRLRIGNREEAFPWNTGFDNFALNVTATQLPIPTLTQWGMFALLLSIAVLGYARLRPVHTR